MDSQALLNEAQLCRDMAKTIPDHDGGAFLLSVARGFDTLAAERMSVLATEKVDFDSGRGDQTLGPVAFQISG